MRFAKFITSIRSKISQNTGNGKLTIKNLIGSVQSKNGTTQDEFEFLDDEDELRSCEEMEILEKYNESGWTVRAHLADPRFRSCDLHNRNVKFALRDEQSDSMREYSGVFQAYGKHGAHFKLEGREEIFNYNLVGAMAVQPA